MNADATKALGLRYLDLGAVQQASEVRFSQSLSEYMFSFDVTHFLVKSRHEIENKMKTVHFQYSNKNSVGTSQ